MIASLVRKLKTAINSQLRVLTRSYIVFVFHDRLKEQSARANKLLGTSRETRGSYLGTAVRRTLFLGLVRPHLGYATQIWAPQSTELTAKLERIQRRATRFILNLPYSSTISYNSHLQTLNLLPVCYWNGLSDLIFFFKITHGLVNVDPSVLPDVRKYRRTRSTTTNVNIYILNKCKTTT